MLLAVPTWMVYVGSFIVVLGPLIFVHELGHFLAAKAVGIQVHRFSIGLGRPIPGLRFRWGETEYWIAWLPFGGYVKMAGMEEEGPAAELEGGAIEPADDEASRVPPERMFDRKSLPARFLVVLAGVTMNFVFAVLIYMGLAATVGQAVNRSTSIDSVQVDSLPAGAERLAALERGDRIVAVSGTPVTSWRELQEAFLFADDPVTIDVEGRPSLVLQLPRNSVEARARTAAALRPLWPAAIASVAEDSPAERAELVAGDTIVAIDGEVVRSWGHMASLIRPRGGDTLALTLRRSGVERVVRVVPESGLGAAPGEGEQPAAIGIRPLIDRERHGLASAAVVGFGEAVARTKLVLFFLQELLMLHVSPRELGGPVVIGQVSGQQAQLGLLPLLEFMAFLSVNLAVLNLLPIPVLDGGHVVFLLIEAVRRKPLSTELRARLTQVGFVVLVGIMLFAVANDLLRIFGN